MKNRIEKLDYLKCVFIILMVIFHLAYIGDKYPYLKSIVYTFHMSGFLIISGYLVNTKKEIFPFLRTIMWIFIPYAVMEFGYVLMASVFPIREHINTLTPWVLVEKIFVAPLGPYWYLHTLVICCVACYFVDKLRFLKPIERIMLLCTLLFVLSHLGLMAFSNAIYFLLGFVVRQSRVAFTSMFLPSILSAIPLVVLCCFSGNLNRGSLAGITITYLSISFLMATYPMLPRKLKSASSFIGRNTMVILLFSPIFTLLSKQIIPFFEFDSSGILFTVVATVSTILGCFAIALAMDKLNVSRFFLGRKQILV